ncbi:MAG: hypothetical protein PHX46_04175 [Bacilli bacterium]|jgi:hypothetical protein|nr:hypothetical protein [Bacilli bacterium]
MKYNYNEIIDKINSNMIIYEEDDFIYFMEPNLNDGSLVFQEKEHCLIMWSDEIKGLSFYSLYKLFLDEYKVSLIFPYVETKEEVDDIKKLGGVLFDFASAFPEEEEICYDYSREFGSFIISR